MNDRILLNCKLDEIAKVLKVNYNTENHIGVLSGLSGISLFFFYYAKYINSDEYADLGVLLMQNALKKINEGYSFSTYCTGIAGFAWTLEFLNEKKIMDVDNDNILSDLDNFLYSIMISDIQKKNYDFLHGALGYGFYFLKRYKNTKSKILKNKYKNYILELISILNKISENDENGVKWISMIDKQEDISGYNLGLSHGISSIVNFLSRLNKYDDFKTMTEMLLRKSVKYLLSSKNKKVDVSLFPNRVIIDRKKNINSRLAWCYGDLGIGITLWQVSKSLNDTKLKENAFLILKYSIKRKTTEETMVKDAAICHGAYGMAQIFNRMYYETNDSEFKEAAIFWIKKGQDMAIHKNGFAGYKQWLGKDILWINKTGLLEGVAGIGLSIISYLTDDNTWDEVLLIS